MSKEYLYLASLTNNDFLNEPAYFNKCTTLPIQFIEEVLEKDDILKAKYYYTIIRALISNAKRFDLIKHSSNAINRELLYKSLKQINKSSYTKQIFKRDMFQIKESTFFNKVTNDYILLNKKDLILTKEHSVYSDYVLKKNKTFTLQDFTKYSVLFLKDKALAHNKYTDDVNVISDLTVSNRLGISSSRVKQISKNHLKIYQFFLLNEREADYRINIQDQYVNKVSIGKEKLGLFSSGSRVITNINYKSLVRNKTNNLVKLNELSNSSKKDYKNLTLKSFRKQDNIPVTNKYNIDEINKCLYKSYKDSSNTNMSNISDTNIVSNLLLANKHLIRFNMVSKNYKSSFRQIIKYLYAIRFSNHLKKEYDITINISLNKDGIRKILDKITGIYLNIENKTLITIKKFNTLLKTLKNDFLLKDLSIVNVSSS